MYKMGSNKDQTAENVGSKFSLITYKGNQISFKMLKKLFLK